LHDVRVRPGQQHFFEEDRQEETPQKEIFRQEVTGIGADSLFSAAPGGRFHSGAWRGRTFLIP
jgi:hypothetical protein